MSPVAAISETQGALARAVEATGSVDGEVIAAGQLRQGKTPTPLSVITGWVLVDMWRPRRLKSLPRHFVMGVTRDRVYAFKAVGGGGDSDSDDYVVRMAREPYGSWPRDAVCMTDLPKGDQSKGGTLHIGDDQLPVFRPNLNGEANTDALIALLAR
jgi:hypothetical protein